MIKTIDGFNVPTSILRILNIFKELKIEKINILEKNSIFNLFIIKLIENINITIYNLEIDEVNLKKYSSLIYIHNELIKLIKNNNYEFNISNLNLQNSFIPENKYENRNSKSYKQSFIYSYSHHYYENIKDLTTIYKTRGILIFANVFLNKIKKIEFYLYSEINYSKKNSKYSFSLLNNFFNESIIKDQIYELCNKNKIEKTTLFLIDFWDESLSKINIIEKIYKNNFNPNNFNYNFLIGETEDKKIYFSKKLNITKKKYDYFDDNKLCKFPKNDYYEEELVLFNDILLIKGRFIDNNLSFNSVDLKFYYYDDTIPLKYILMNKNNYFLTDKNKLLYLNMYLYDIYDNKIFKILNEGYFISNYKIICDKKKILNLRYLIKVTSICSWKKFINKNNINLNKNYDLLKVYKLYIKKMDDGNTLKDYFENHGIEEILENMLKFENFDSIDYIFENIDFTFNKSNIELKFNKKLKNENLLKDILIFIISIKLLK